MCLANETFVTNTNGQECKCIVGSCTCIKDQEGLILIELNKKGEICL